MLEADDTSKRAEVDDPARPLLAHDRKDRAHDKHHAVEIGRDMPLDFSGTQRLEIPEQTVARVIDQNVDASERLQRRVDRDRRLSFVRARFWRFRAAPRKACLRRACQPEDN